MTPIVSVIIPVYNRDRYLAEAIESVLVQTYPTIELLVVDDGSSDRSAEVAQRYLPKLHYYYQPNGGTSAARNTGISLATGEFLAFLDSDDLWMPEKLLLQMAAFEADPTLDAAFGYVKQFFSSEVSESFRQRILCPKDAIAGYISNMMLIRRSRFLQVGLFNTKLKSGIDIEWYGRAVEHKLKMTLLPNVIHLRRIHETNSGLLHPEHTERLHILKAMLDRRRNPSSTIF